MALFYKQQGYIEKMAKKTSSTSRYASDQRVALFGGRGSKSDELTYLRKQNTSAQGIDGKNTDAWQKFGSANGANTTRADQTFHDFTVNGTFL